ncbi:MAG TPA: hypothetical protein VII13_10790 [Vicinamibacteria bacterium]
MSLALLGATVFARQEPRSFTPSRPAEDVPTFVNAEVIRVASDGTVTFRTESGETVLRASDEALREVSGLRTGDKVLLEYRLRDGRRVITDVEPASPTSGEPGRARASATTTVISPSGGATRSARVIATDVGRRRIMVVDQAGGAFVLPVSRAAASRLGSFAPGDTVGLTFDPALGGSAFGTVTAIQTVDNAALFGAGTLFPTVSGQLVRVDRANNSVVVRSNGAEMTVPVSGVAMGGLGTLRAGDTLALDLGLVGTGVTASGNARLSTVPGGSPFVAVTALQTVPPGTVSVAGGSTLSPNTASPNAPGLSGVTNAGAVAGSPGAPAGAGTPAVGGVVGSTGVGTTAGAAGSGAAAGAGPMGVTGGGPVVVGGGMPGPLTRNVPNVGTPGPVVTAVLPPAVVKAPQSQAEVGLFRAQGERDLDMAAMTLAAAANDIDVAWFGYKQTCLRGFTPESTPGREWFLLLDGRVASPTDDGCRAQFTALQGRAEGFRQQLEVVTDAARRADVLPGTIREILDRHKLDR